VPRDRASISALVAASGVLDLMDAAAR